MLNSMMDITKRCCGVPFLFNDLEAMWRSAATSKGVTEEAISFLVDMLVNSALASKLADDINGKDACSLSLVFLNRTSFSKAVWKSLSAHWVSFTDIDCDGSCVLTGPALTERRWADSTVTLDVITPLLYENPEDSTPYIACLLQNALMLCFQPSTLPIANGIVNYALHCVLRSNSAESVWPLVQTLLSQSTEEREWNSKMLNDVIECLSKVFPKVRTELCSEALKWAANCTHKRNCIDSLHIFRSMLADSEVKAYVPRIAACLSAFVLRGQIDSIVALGDVVLSLPPAILKSDAKSRGILIKAFYALLTTSSATVYAVGLDVLHMLFTDVCPNCDTFVSDLEGMVVDPLSTATLIMRGLLSAPNVSGTFWLAGVLVESSKTPKEVKTLVTVETMLVYAVMIHAKDLDAPLLAHRFSEQAGSRMKKLGDAFAKMDMRNVLVTQQATPEAMMDQFFTAFSETFGPSASGATTVEATFAIDTALVLLRNSVRRTTNAAICLCTHFLSGGSPFVLSETQLLHAAELATFFVRSNTTSIAESAKHLFNAVLEHIPKGVTLAFFDLIHTVPADLHENEKNPDVLVDVSDYDAMELTKSALTLFSDFVLESGKSPLKSVEPSCIVRSQQQCADSSQKPAFGYDVLSSRKGRDYSSVATGQHRPFDTLSSHVVMGNASTASFNNLPK